MMNEEQKKAAKRLASALKAVQKSGLEAAVIEDCLYVWPNGLGPDSELEYQPEAMDIIDDIGMQVSPIGFYIDGGLA